MSVAGYPTAIDWLMGRAHTAEAVVGPAAVECNRSAQHGSLGVARSHGANRGALRLSDGAFPHRWRCSSNLRMFRLTASFPLVLFLQYKSSTACCNWLPSAMSHMPLFATILVTKVSAASFPTE